VSNSEPYISWIWLGNEPRLLEAAYRRHDHVKKRRLMQAWANYLTGKAGAKVVPLRANSA
jgi:hypothetical protein